MSNIPGLGWSYQLGKGKTLAIPIDIHKSARLKLIDIIKSKHSDVSEGIVLLQGGQELYQYDSDTETIFRQDSWFNYLFGVKEPSFYGAINIKTSESILFIPRLTSEYEIWCGKIHTPSYFKDIYGVDVVLYSDEIVQYMQENLSEACRLHIMEGVNSDSGSHAKPASFEGDAAFQQYIDKTKLYHALSTARVTKSNGEITAMQYCAYVASNAHVQVMRSATKCTHEYELEATFLYEIYKNGGCRSAAYTSICACGPNGAVLHYGHAGAPNDRVLDANSDMTLLDMGAEYHGYVSDITCSFPLSGTFTSDQAIIFNGVLHAQRAVIGAMKPGVSWPACHKMAEKEILIALVKAGILINASNGIDELIHAGLGAIFFPHGLGHLIGCDVHDVGGYIDGTPSRHAEPGLKKLRTARILEEGMVLTVEPGCYFIDVLLTFALENPDMVRYINQETLARFRNFGGVRLEDVVVVTSDGCINLTTCPRTIEEIESVMSGGPWPPACDGATYLKRQWCKLSAGGTSMESVNIC